MMHLVPSHKMDKALNFAHIFISNIIRYYRIPDSIVSDHRTLFTSQFWMALSKLLGAKHRLSTLFHPQMDGQTERLNQTIEQYLRIFYNYMQDNWYDLLPVAEFAYNNAFQSTINTSPFYANYGYHPRFMFSTTTTSPLDVPAAKELADKLTAHHDALSETIKFVQDSQARYYDAKHQCMEFNVGDKVWLLLTNINTERPSKILDWKHLGPYTVIERIGLQAYQLQLPSSI